MDIRKVSVVGSGQMGSGIVQVAAQYGFEVTMMDVSEAVLERAQKTIRSSCERLVKKGALSEEQVRELLSRIRTTTQLSDLSQSDAVIEAATENVELKLKIFSELDKTVKKTALLLTNTSSISITKIAAATDRPAQVAGMHFMNPVPLMKLVEGIRGLQTSDETFAATRSLAEKMDKVFVESTKDMPGFIVNRILMPMINEAIYALHEGIASVEAIDSAMKLGTNQPMGPLTLADFIGLDTCLAIMNVLHQGLGDSKYRPCPLLVKYVEAGWLGRKSGRGFYSYEGAK
ncbi:MAG: 3-hydroxybutyryl-CoA dehydrogenase [Bdellovibrionaceae bacterium]|nr:3-hydroxybutyryl-CoA dehydrogenase [Pseudobdellovibrionaceae bacterium]